MNLNWFRTYMWNHNNNRRWTYRGNVEHSYEYKIGKELYEEHNKQKWGARSFIYVSQKMEIRFRVREMDGLCVGQHRSGPGPARLSTFLYYIYSIYPQILSVCYETIKIVEKQKKWIFH
jgi:hypothetical protein